MWVYVCACMYVYMCVGINVYGEWVWMWKPEVDVQEHSLCSFLFIGAEPLSQTQRWPLWLVFFQFALSVSFKARVTGWSPRSSSIYVGWFWRSELWSSHLRSELFNHWAIFPAPGLLIKSWRRSFSPNKLVLNWRSSPTWDTAAVWPNLMNKEHWARAGWEHGDSRECIVMW